MNNCPARASPCTLPLGVKLGTALPCRSAMRVRDCFFSIGATSSHCSSMSFISACSPISSGRMRCETIVAEAPAVRAVPPPPVGTASDVPRKTSSRFCQPRQSCAACVASARSVEPSVPSSERPRQCLSFSTSSFITASSAFTLSSGGPVPAPPPPSAADAPPREVMLPSPFAAFALPSERGAGRGRWKPSRSSMSYISTKPEQFGSSEYQSAQLLISWKMELRTSADSLVSFRAKSARRRVQRSNDSWWRKEASTAGTHHSMIMSTASVGRESLTVPVRNPLLSARSAAAEPAALLRPVVPASFSMSCAPSTTSAHASRRTAFLMVAARISAMRVSASATASASSSLSKSRSSSSHSLSSVASSRPFLAARNFCCMMAPFCCDHCAASAETSLSSASWSSAPPLRCGPRADM
mmetsp:Transcript_14130/g.35887  ORF Transcript_14130/g.35887 Transcript_14130/m.35887 type:complete len:413 (-) Transcript_14130:2251-3489(-)